MNEALLTRTVQEFPKDRAAIEFGSTSIFLNISTTASKIEPWGKDWVKRDLQLRAFWKKEPFLASAIYSIVATRTSFNWEVDGPPRTVKQVHTMLQESEFGDGFGELKKKVAVDLLTQDNGAFVEIIRGPKPKGWKPEAAPVIGLAHLDAGSCIRTGNPRSPVLYIDDDGKLHRLKWYQVITFEEMPSPEKQHKGRQVSFLSRVLNAAVILKEINTYQEEKISGRFSRAVHFIGGVAQHEIESLQENAQLNADNMGLTRYMQPIMMAALDPNARVSKETVELASLPDSFDFDEMMKWYVSLIAMAAGGDYQDFAPLPGGNLGTASQSETLHQKSRIKGHQLWMKLWEHKLQHHKVIPPNVTFRYLQQDAQAELQEADLKHKRAVTRATRIKSGEISLEVARQTAVDDGDLKQEYLMMMGEADQTPTITVHDDELPPDPTIFEQPHDGSDQTFVTGGTNGNTAPNNEGRLVGGRAPKDEQEAADATKSRSPVSARVAFRAAHWIKHLIEAHPIQAVAPIQTSKLSTFTQWLQNQIKYEMSIGTNAEGWQDRILTKAAYESGIHPHVLRYRLPDEYRLFIFKDRVVDSRGVVLYTLPDENRQIKNKAAIAHGSNCYVCGKAHHRFAYLPNRRWVSVCKEHDNRGLLGRETEVQYDLRELQESFTTQFNQIIESGEDRKVRPLILSSMLYAFELGKGASMNEKEKSMVLQTFSDQSRLLEISKNAGPFGVTLTNLYYKGVGVSWKEAGNAQTGKE